MASGRGVSGGAPTSLRTCFEERWVADVAELAANTVGSGGGGGAPDPDRVHRARVAARRLRSDLRVFAPVLRTGSADALAGELRWIGACLGTVRDLDVLSELVRDVLAATGRDPGALGVELGRRRAAAAQDLASILAGARTERLLTELGDGAATLPITAGVHLGDGPAVLTAALRRSWRRLERAVDAAGGDPADDDLHQIRIRAKRVRYGAEACRDAGIDDAAALAARLTVVQDHLGRQHDHVVAAAWMRSNGPTLAGPAAFLAGAVEVLASGTAAGARTSWRPAWRRARRRRPGTWADPRTGG